jgi:hypothetical protein
MCAKLGFENTADLQVVSDLGNMLEAMREQQAEVEERVESLQTAVQHLLPADVVSHSCS